ncbi:MAG: FHA domain-containing protein [Armatimonadota bacterium]
MIKLEIIGGPYDGKEYKFNKSIKIGRDKSADISIYFDNFASRIHTGLEIEGKKCILKDMNSTNGTYIGNNKINEVELKDKDIFKVGRTLFKVEIY